MHRKHVVMMAAVVTGITAMVYLAVPPQSRTPAEPASTSSSTSLSVEEGRYLFNVSLHTPEEIAGMLTRAEQLARTRRADTRHTGIALVLHGPEIAIFARKNYTQFHKLVDQAAHLDAERIIELKMCRTEMKHLGIQEEDIPAFIELVPYGPDEEERLRRSGYVYL